MSVKDVLENFARTVQQKAKEKLASKSNTGKLANSIKYKLDSSPDEYELTFTTEAYGAYVDQGVRGRVSSSRAPNSPFKFGTGKGEKGGLSKGIAAWVERKRIQFRNKDTGRFLSYKATAWLITRSIYNKGLPATGFITKPFEEEYFKLPKKILDAYMPEVLEKIRKAIKQ